MKHGFITTTLITLLMLASSTSAFARALPQKKYSLSNEVRHELVMLPYYGIFDWLEYEVKGDDTVVLTGEVTRPTLKSDAGNAVRRIEGVTNVVNNLRVLPLSPNDNRIRRAIYRALFNLDSPLFHYSQSVVPSIHIIVDNGRVTLRGTVVSEADRNYAGVMANEVSGIFELKNELRVE